MNRERPGLALEHRAASERYRRTSYWLESVDDDLTPRAPLKGAVTADVAILGAGYSGLWTAYYLLQRQPDLRVIILEREIAGFGASGRNGGWCTSGFPLSPAVLEERFGPEAARCLLLSMAGAVDEVERVCEEEGIDADLVKGGVLRLARGPQGLPGLQQAWETYGRIGLADRYQLLDAEAIERRVRVAGALGGLFTPDGASIHPGRLVRGLARAVERRGAAIFERTAVARVEAGTEPRLLTAEGAARAGTVAVCGEAYLSELPPFRRQLIPVYSLIGLTEPLSEQQWSDVGWEGRECLSSTRYTVDYLNRTRDGRILFGSRGAPYHLGSKMVEAYEQHGPTQAMIRSLFKQWFPALARVRFTHFWGGAVGMPRDSMPTVSYDSHAGLASARGYTGQGVATSNLAGRALADLILGVESPLVHLPFINHRSPNWEPEPLRWLGVRYVQSAYGRIDARAERTGRAPSGRSLAERLGKH